jgi:hypothetical protein
MTKEWCRINRLSPFPAASYEGADGWGVSVYCQRSLISSLGQDMHVTLLSRGRRRIGWAVLGSITIDGNTPYPNLSCEVRLIGVGYLTEIAAEIDPLYGDVVYVNALHDMAREWHESGLGYELLPEDTRIYLEWRQAARDLARLIGREL